MKITPTTTTTILITVTSRNPQPTTNQQPTAKSQQATPSRTFPATTNIGVPTTNFQLLTSDHKQLMITNLFIMSICCGYSGVLRCSSEFALALKNPIPSSLFGRFSKSEYSITLVRNR